MSEASGPPCPRAMRLDEQAIVAALLEGAPTALGQKIGTDLVEDMADGGMGGITFVGQSAASRRFGRTLAEAEYIDSDGVPVLIGLSLDDKGALYELDFWKVDYSPLCTYPTPARLQRLAWGPNGEPIRIGRTADSTPKG